MVIGAASKLGFRAIGYDLDPLACMISRANGTSINATTARKYCCRLLDLANSTTDNDFYLPWIDEDQETVKYIDFWFAKKQRHQLRVLSYFLVKEPFISDMRYLDILKISFSRLIVTKDPKASLARDTAHSRPHRTILENDFDVFSVLERSLERVLLALQPSKIARNAKIFLGDARKMTQIDDESVDCIVTSPPYLNAIDYMRGHRLSLVWLGFTLPQLREVRRKSVGAELTSEVQVDEELRCFLNKLNEEVEQKKRRMLARYYRDLCHITKEAQRVLRSGCKATYVIGNSNIKGHEIDNSELLTLAAKRNGFVLRERYEREIPENRRYMPLQNSTGSNISKRMRSEHVLIFEKPSKTY